MADRLTCTVNPGPGHVVLTVEGECDATTSDQFRAAVELVMPQAADRVMLDFSGLTFVDSSGVHALLDARRSLAAIGTVLVAPCPQPIVARILTLPGTDQLVHVAGTKSGAWQLGE